LINDDRRACLADFGLTTIIPDSIAGYSVTAVESAGTARWMAPQLLVPEEYGLTKCTLTKESDIYALGMVMYEVLPFISVSSRLIKLCDLGHHWGSTI
jgi:serine/threonine protein kinase